MRRLRHLAILLAVVLAAALPALGVLPAEAVCKVPSTCKPNSGGSGAGSAVQTPGSHGGRATPQLVNGRLTPGDVSISGSAASQIRLAAIVSGFNPNGFLSGSAYDPVNHSVYVASEDTTTHTAYAIDAFSLAVTPITNPSFCFSSGVAVNQQTGEVYINNQSAFCGGMTMNTVTVLSPQNQVEAVIPISRQPLFPSHIAVDSGRDLIYVADQTNTGFNPPANPGDIVMISGQSKTVVNRFSGPAIEGPLGIAVDPATGFVYVTNNVDGNYFPNTLTGINPFTGAILGTVGVGTSPGVAVDQHGNIVLAQGADFFFTGSVQIVNASNLMVTNTIPTPAGPSGFSGLSSLSISQIGGMIYAADPDDGFVFAVNPYAGVQATIALNGVNELSSNSIAVNGLVFQNLPALNQVLVLQGP